MPELLRDGSRAGFTVWIVRMCPDIPDLALHKVKWVLSMKLQYTSYTRLHRARS